MVAVIMVAKKAASIALKPSLDKSLFRLSAIPPIPPI